MNRSIFAVVLAGGGGERFWPVTSKDRPKQFLNLIGDRTMLQQTVDRLSGIVDSFNIYVITANGYGGLVKEQVPEIPPANVVEEPCSRDTAAAVALAAAYISQRDPKGIMMVFPADHYVADGARFLRVMRIASDTARKGEWLLTIGITPTRPETGYGYIQRGELLKTVGSLAIGLSGGRFL